jgi:hypothetical protein
MLTFAKPVTGNDADRMVPWPSLWQSHVFVAILIPQEFTCLCQTKLAWT